MNLAESITKKIEAIALARAKLRSMHSVLSYGLSFAPKLQRVGSIHISGSDQPTPDPSLAPHMIKTLCAKFRKQNHPNVTHFYLLGPLFCITFYFRFRPILIFCMTSDLSRSNKRVLGYRYIRMCGTSSNSRGFSGCTPPASSLAAQRGRCFTPAFNYCYS